MDIVYIIILNLKTMCVCVQNDDRCPPVLRRHSSSDISKQKFGTMPLVPIRGDESNSTMLSANQTLVNNLEDIRVCMCLCVSAYSLIGMPETTTHNE